MEITKYQKLFGVGPTGFLIGLLIMCLLWLLDYFLGHIPILSQPRSIRITGIILIAIWIFWHSWCMKTIRAWWQHDHLCTTGPYRFVRHPIYAGGLWFGWLGVSLLLDSWIILFQPFITYPILSLLVRKEEAMMTDVFGEEYQRYAARTGRLFPRIV
jgi:protein-S-isoprenylcysteine O-methyltransferase Ste14